MTRCNPKPRYEYPARLDDKAFAAVMAYARKHDVSVNRAINDLIVAYSRDDEANKSAA